jgi:hypothetical protein
LNGHQAILFSYSVIALFLVWTSIFGAWRSYRVSALQEDLGRLRARLLDLIAAGHVSASAPEVKRFRLLLDAAIRQCSMMTLTRFQLAYLARRWGLLEPGTVVVENKSAELLQLDEEMRIRIARHIISGCPLLWFFLPTAISAAFVSNMFQAAWPRGAGLIPGLAVLDTLLESAGR